MNTNIDLFKSRKDGWKAVWIFAQCPFGISPTMVSVRYLWSIGANATPLMLLCCYNIQHFLLILNATNQSVSACTTTTSAVTAQALLQRCCLGVASCVFVSSAHDALLHMLNTFLSAKRFHLMTQLHNFTQHCSVMYANQLYLFAYYWWSKEKLMSYK